MNYIVLLRCAEFCVMLFLKHIVSFIFLNTFLLAQFFTGYSLDKHFLCLPYNNSTVEFFEHTHTQKYIKIEVPFTNSDHFTPSKTIESCFLHVGYTFLVQREQCPDRENLRKLLNFLFLQFLFSAVEVN